MAETTNLYKYEPSLAAGIIFALLFAPFAFVQTYQLVRTRTWFFLPFIVGSYFELVGYIFRTLSASQSPNYSLGPFIIQELLILVAPAIFAASIYMELGRIIELTNGEKHSIVGRRWLTKLFVAGDMLSFFAQAAGAGSMSGHNAAAITRGQTIILVGLVIQILAFSLFMLTAAIFHFRMIKQPSSKILAGDIPWLKHMYALYGASFLILVRCIFRLIEYAQGRSGSLMSSEVYLYIFDASLMLSTVAIFTAIHPSEINALLMANGGKAVRNGVLVYQMV